MADESESVKEPKNDYEIFWDRIKEEDRVLVKAPIATQPSKTCYFLGTVKATSIHTEDGNHVVVIQLEGERDRRAIKLENIGSIEYVKKTIIPMDFIFKDENIKAGEIKTENEKIKAEFDCEEFDPNCDGEEFGDDEEIEIEVDEKDFKDVKEIDEEEIETDSSAVEEEFVGGKKKKKKNRSRSKKNKKKRKRRNSTKKKN